jgi:hypothetical protein
MIRKHTQNLMLNILKIIENSISPIAHLAQRSFSKKNSTYMWPMCDPCMNYEWNENEFKLNYKWTINELNVN